MTARRSPRVSLRAQSATISTRSRSPPCARWCRDQRLRRALGLDLPRRGKVNGLSTMTYITKPKFHHPALPKNALGYTHRDYEGSVSTLCAGCGHDSISGAIIEACFELDIEPHR